MFVYMGKPKESAKILLELINTSSYVTGYKINLKTPFVFLYTSSERLQNEINKIVPFIVISKNIK